MDENLHPIDELFKQAMETHDDVPSSAVWENLSEKLDRRKVVSLDKKYKRLKWVAAALMIFCCGMAIYTWHLKTDLKILVKQQKTRSAEPLPNKDISDAGHSKSNNLPKQNTSTNYSSSAIEVVVGSESSRLSGTNGTYEKYVEAKKNNEVDAKQLEKDSRQVAGASTNTVSKFSKVWARKLVVSNNAENSKPKIDHQPILHAALADGGKSLIAESNNESDNSYVLKGFSLENDLAVVAAKMIVSPTLKPGAHSSPLHATPSPKNEFSDLVTAITKGNKSKYMASIFFSPDLIFTRLESDRPRFKEDDKHEIRTSESTKVSSSFGVAISRRLNDRFSLRLGGSIATITKDIKPRRLFARPDNKGNIKYRISCSSGFAYVATKAGSNPSPGDSITSVSAKHTLQYISVPLALQYHLNSGRFTFSTAAGVSGNFLSKANIETTIATASGNEKLIVKNIEGLRPFYLTGVIDLGIAYHVNRFMDVNFNPTARIAFSSLTKNGPVKTYMNSVGVAFGASFRL